MQNFIYFYLKGNDCLYPIGSFADDQQIFHKFSTIAPHKKLYGVLLKDTEKIEKSVDLDIIAYNSKIQEEYNAINAIAGIDFVIDEDIKMKEITYHYQKISEYNEIIDELKFAKYLCQYFYKILYEFQWVENNIDVGYIYVGIDCSEVTIENIEG